MLAKYRPLAIGVLAAATFSAGAVAAQTYVDVRIAPPPPRQEAIPVVRPGYAWVPGYWDWRGHRHVWVNGHWERARHGYVYREPRWEQNGNSWRLHHGSWDRDHDGVPNAVDSHPNNPRRP